MVNGGSVLFWSTPGVRDQAPLTIATGATQAPFAAAAMRQALAQEGSLGYKASAPLLWVDWCSAAGCPDADIPFNPKQIQIMETHYFATPAPLTRDVVVRLKTGQDVQAQKGAWCGKCLNLDCEVVRVSVFRLLCGWVLEIIAVRFCFIY